MSQPKPYRYQVIVPRSRSHTDTTEQGSSYTPTQYMVNGQMRNLAISTRDGGNVEGESEAADSEAEDESSDDTAEESAEDSPEKPAQDGADDDEAESDDDSDEESAKDEPVPSEPESEGDSGEESEEGPRSILKSTVSTGGGSHKRKVGYSGRIKSNTEGTSKESKKKATFGSGRSEKQNRAWWDELDPNAKVFEKAQAEARARARADSIKTSSEQTRASQSGRGPTVVDMERRAYRRPR